MNETINVESVEYNRRFNPRHKSKTQVFIIGNGKRISCKAINLSGNGVGIVSETDTPLGMRPGMTCELTFVINLGKIMKLHRRIAKVVHVTNGVTGLAMDKYEGK